MKDLLKYLTWILIAGLLGAAFYFFIYKPALQSEYKRGLEQCRADTDTLYSPGKDSVVYRDTSFSAIKPVIAEETDSLLSLATSFDTTVVFDKDSISISSDVKINIDNIENILSRKLTASWLTKITHKDFQKAPDTLKVFYPRYIETIKKETNWMLTGIAYVAGVLSAIAIFFLAR